MSNYEPLEQAAAATTPVSIGVSGMTLLGLSLDTWVLIGTALLILFQLIVILPKVFNTLIQLRETISQLKRDERDSTDSVNLEEDQTHDCVEGTS